MRERFGIRTAIEVFRCTFRFFRRAMAPLGTNACLSLGAVSLLTTSAQLVSDSSRVNDNSSSVNSGKCSASTVASTRRNSPSPAAAAELEDESVGTLPRDSTVGRLPLGGREDQLALVGLEPSLEHVRLAPIGHGSGERFVGVQHQRDGDLAVRFRPQAPSRCPPESRRSRSAEVRARRATGRSGDGGAGRRGRRRVGA